jgi:hypothetical protein
MLPVLCAGSVLAACGTAALPTSEPSNGSSAEATSPVSTVLLTRHGGLLFMPPFSHTVTSTAQTEQLYAAVWAMHPAPPSKEPFAAACPVAFGANWTMQFLDGSTPVLFVTAETDGCQALTLNNGLTADAIDTGGPQIWAAVEADTGLPAWQVVPRLCSPPSQTTDCFNE